MYAKRSPACTPTVCFSASTVAEQLPQYRIGAGVDIVYCDKCAALSHVRDLITKHAPLKFHGVLSGSTPKHERARVCAAMKSAAGGIALFSKVGNASIDIPDVDLVIELSVVDRSAQQRTQREGRAQRAHEHKTSADVVTIVSKGTREEHFVKKRDTATLPDERALLECTDCPWSDSMLTCFVDDKKRRVARKDGPPRKRSKLLTSSGRR
tara:strand:+ start:798 stop:1427 length:630 start_codon:yes stop_codon:yes gene_type:complete